MRLAFLLNSCLLADHFNTLQGFYQASCYASRPHGTVRDRQLTSSRGGVLRLAPSPKPWQGSTRVTNVSLSSYASDEVTPQSTTLDGRGWGSHRWALSLAPIIAALLVIGAGMLGPGAVLAANTGGPDRARKPILEILVQLPDEETDWTKLTSDAGQVPGANMLIMATQQGSDKPVLGATVSMDKLAFPVLMQLSPKNAIGGAQWPSDFAERGAFGVKVTVCGGAEARAVMCERPSLVGSGESVFVSQLEDVPELAQAGGVRVPASVVLAPQETFLK